MEKTDKKDAGINFTNKQLFLIIIPLIIESLFAVALGMVDTIMVSSVGESAVSGVSLVDTINILLIGVFMSLSTGGYVIISQALGRKNNRTACRYSNQMVLTIVTIALVIMIIAVVFNRTLLNLMFGDAESDVMENAVVYFYLTALSYPFLALHSGCSTVFRSMGKNKVLLYVSLVLNLLNVAGNYFFIIILGWNAAGAGMSTLIARIIGSSIMLFLALQSKNKVHLTNPFKWRFNFKTINKMMKISVPTTIDGIIFQIGKIVLQSLTVTFGTSAIAGNAIAGQVAGFVYIPGNVIGIVLIMVVGQLVGAREFDKINYYTKKLIILGMGLMCFLNILVFIFMDPILGLYHLTEEGADIAKNIISLHCITSTLFWTFSFTLPNALRAANDARYTMIISIISMWLCRIGFSYVLCMMFGVGVIGIWIAMAIDWVFRSVFFIHRFKSKKWMMQVL